MALMVIPLEDAKDLGAFEFSTDLDGVDYLCSFQYNSREGFWYFDLLDLEENPLRSGIKVVSNFPFLRLMVELERPPGELMAVDTRTDCNDPGLDEFGIDSVFAYEQEVSLP